MKPTLGRIVIYMFLPEERGPFTNRANEAAAIVVRDWNFDGLVNLKVLVDGPIDLWKTSIHEGDAPGTWHWPPRVA